MTILYFGLARELAGVSEETLVADGPITVAELWERLIARHPSLVPCRAASRVAADMSYVGEHDTLGNAAEVAIIPPVAGG